MLSEESKVTPLQGVEATQPVNTQVNNIGEQRRARSLGNERGCKRERKNDRRSHRGVDNSSTAYGGCSDKCLESAEALLVPSSLPFGSAGGKEDNVYLERKLEEIGKEKNCLKEKDYTINLDLIK